MRLIGLAVVLSASLILMPIGAETQQAGKVYRIGYLGTTTSAPHTWDAFLRGLRELGWIEGQTIVIEQRNAEERYERLPELAADLVRLRVDVIVAAGPVAPLAAKQATNTIPIVMTNHGDPVGSGLVASLGRPGTNVTGLSFLHPAVVATGRAGERESPCDVPRLRQRVR
jgi:putative ABC transport system substrate-binding protein